MDACCITLDQIESRTATSLALAIYARRLRDGFLALTVGFPILTLLNLRLSQLKTPLRSGALDSLSDEQLNEVAGLLKQLNASLVRIGQNEELRSQSILTKSLAEIEEYVEDFDSILENIYLSLSPDFHRVVSLAISRLGLEVEDRVTLPR